MLTAKFSFQHLDLTLFEAKNVEIASKIAQKLRFDHFRSKKDRKRFKNPVKIAQNWNVSDSRWINTSCTVLTPAVLTPLSAQVLISWPGHDCDVKRLTLKREAWTDYLFVLLLVTQVEMRCHHSSFLALALNKLADIFGWGWHQVEVYLAFVQSI